jgi:hydrogenase expression/formation protein HypC
MCLGIPGQITRIVDTTHQLATVEVGGVKRTINIACIVDVEHPLESCLGEWVLVHVGFALNRLDETEARTTLELFRQLAELNP